MRKKWCLPVLVAGAALAGCSSTSGQILDPASTESPADALPIRLKNGTSVGIDDDPPELIGDVGYTGTITTVDGGCWGLDRGDSTSVLFLVEGATPTPEGLGVVTTDGVELHIGDRIYAGGYGVPPGSAADRRWRGDRPDCFRDHVPAVYVSVKGVDTEPG